MSLEVRRSDAAAVAAAANAADVSPFVKPQAAGPRFDAVTAKLPTSVDTFVTANPANAQGTGEGEALPIIMLGFALLLRTMLATGASMSGRTLLSRALAAGGKVIRVNGSHHIVKMPNGRTAPIPVHGNRDLPKGTLQSIKKALGI